MKEVMRVLGSAGYRGSNLTVVPGNHDRYNLRGTGDFEKQVSLRPYPHVDHPNDQVAIVGLDSTVRDSELDWRDALVMSSRGIISIEQIEAADRILARLGERVFKILCCHHHVVELPADGYADSFGTKFDARLTGKAQNADQLMDVAKARGVGLILFGHRHRATHDQFAIRGIASACSGAVTQPGNDGLLRYRVFDFEGGALMGRKWIEVNERDADMAELSLYLDRVPEIDSQMQSQSTKVRSGEMGEGIAKAKARAKEREREVLEKVRARMEGKKAGG
jgi:3',5'-cyclic AMP phosphodiesterase CpdA